jgi:hypothetical protein
MDCHQTLSHADNYFLVKVAVNKRTATNQAHPEGLGEHPERDPQLAGSRSRKFLLIEKKIFSLVSFTGSIIYSESVSC